MKSEKNILVAFILNLAFAVFEFFGGAITGSVAIISDAVHDIGDAASIGISYVLERKSRKQPDDFYTYGYARYSVLSGMITTMILLLGSVMVIASAINRITSPVDIHYDGMLFLAIIGVFVNFLAAWFTKDGDSINQKAVNLHMLEDVLGWFVVLVGTIIMRFTDIKIIDPIMSIGVALFIIVNAIQNLKEVFSIFLEKIPEGLSMHDIKERLCLLEGVEDVHHIHLRSIDGHNNCATMHVVTNEDSQKIKALVRKELREQGIAHATLELEKPGEICCEQNCYMDVHHTHHGHHHHHH